MWPKEKAGDGGDRQTAEAVAEDFFEAETGAFDAAVTASARR
jgi:hypothetical protein